MMKFLDENSSQLTDRLVSLMAGDEPDWAERGRQIAQCMAQAKIFSFRAECLVDVQRFKAQCEKLGLASILSAREGVAPDVGVEMETAASLEIIQDVMRSVVDGHVMRQTLRECPLSENSLERDYDLL